MKKLHLLSNAHLDPVWQWQWQEGVGAAITTFSAAADFCEEFGEYIFCHNEAVLYQWIEEYDPALFARIQKLVAAGKWHIMGGWYLQPDCNMPSGESFVRQIMTGLRYFEEKFPTFQRPTVAINFDSFGHTRGLVQILNDAGYRGYIAMRPSNDREDRNEIWRGYNDSEVVLYRVFYAYNTLLGQVDKRLEPFLTKLEHMETGLFLWGVGNHGGGPSRQDYRIIEELKKKYPKIEMVHSTPEKYFDEVLQKRETFEDAGDLNYVNMGCYSSMIRIKQLHQKLENELFSAEKMAAHAAAYGMPFDRAALKRAEEDLLFCEFHDILPGSCIKSAEDDAITTLSHGISETEKVKIKAFFGLVGGQKRAEPGEYPIFIYHPHPYATTQTLECEFMLADQNWSEEEFNDVELFVEGRKIPCQLEKEGSNIPLDWRKRVVFTMELQPFSVTRVSVFTKLKPVQLHRLAEVRENFVFDNGTLRAEVSAKTGLLESLSAGGETFLKAGTFSLDLTKNCCDPWGFNYDDYREKLGSFSLLDETESAKFAAVERQTLCPVRVIEDGEVRTVVEALFGFGASRAALRYTFPKRGTQLEVNLDLFNSEKDVKLKLRVASALGKSVLKGRTSFGRNDLKQDGGEVVAQDYVVMSDGAHALSVVHFGNYGLDCDGESLHLTLLNSAAYTGHPIDKRVIMRDDRYGARIDQGERHFRFVLNFGDSTERLASVESESAALHQLPFVLNYFPTGNGTKSGAFLELSNRSISLSAFKPAEEGEGSVIRLFNSMETEQTTELNVKVAGIRQSLTFRPYEFKTFMLRGGKLTQTNCLEEEI